MAKGPPLSLTAWWPHAEKWYHAALQTVKNTANHYLFLFFSLTCPARVSEAILTPGCQRVDPNILCSNFLKIRLNVGWIILSDLLIWQFVLTYCVQCGPACFWVIYCLMPAEQFNLTQSSGLVTYNIFFIINHDGYRAWFYFWEKTAVFCSFCHPLASRKETNKTIDPKKDNRYIGVHLCLCFCAYYYWMYLPCILLFCMYLLMWCFIYDLFLY